MDRIFTYVVAFLLLYVTINAVKSWVHDLIFYRNNAWDFSKDSGGSKMFPGGAKIPMRGVAPFSNKQRVLFGYPLLLFIFFIVLFVIAYFESYDR